MRAAEGSFQTRGGNRRLKRSLSLLLVGMLIAALAPVSSALATHEAAHPQPSAPNCKWYGSAEWERHMRTDRDDGSWQESSDKASGWSGPSEDGTCRGSLTYVHSLSAGWSGGGCSASVNGKVPATYENYWVYSIFYANFHAQEPLSYSSTCSGDGSPTPWEDFALSTWCDVPGVEPTKTQAVVTTCTETTTSSDGESGTSTETYRIRMRRTVCDRTVDSDADHLSDCKEFALNTETHNPDTDGDGLTDGDEVLVHDTDPLIRDTDGGGVNDGDEVTAATEPLDPTDDYDDCRWVNTSFVAIYGEDVVEVTPGQYPRWLRYSWSDMRFCYGPAGARLLSTGSRLGEVEDMADVAAALELLGMKFEYGGSGPVTVERLSDDSLEAKVKGKMKFCTQIPLLGPLISKGIKIVLDLVPKRIRERLREWGARKIFESQLIPDWVKDKIILRGYKAIINSFDALSDRDFFAVTDLFKSIMSKVGDKLIELVLGDGVCIVPWHPEIVARFSPDGSYHTFAQGPTGPFTVFKDF